MLSSWSFARNDDARLAAQIKNEFGQDLTKAPYFLRFAFQKAFSKKWENSYYYERKEFLIRYEKDLAANKAKEKAEAKAAADKEKERLRVMKEALKKEKDRLKARQAEQKAEQQEYDQRQKNFNNNLKEQKKELKQMMRDASQGNM